MRCGAGGPYFLSESTTTEGPRLFDFLLAFARSFGSSKGDHMKPALNKFTLALRLILMGTLLSGTAFASCGDTNKSKPGASLLPQLWDGQSGYFNTGR